MDPDLELDFLISIINLHVYPKLHSFRHTGGGSINKTLWYVRTDGEYTDVDGPLKFDSDYFRSRGYHEEAISDVLETLIRAKRSSGLVISFDFYVQSLNVRMHKPLRIFP